MAAKAGGSSMAPSNFGRLLASSRFASYQPSNHQAYTASPANIARGNFGLKRPLPTQNAPIGSIRYVDVGAMDSKQGGFTQWTECEHEVLLRKRANEMHLSKAPEDVANDRHRDRTLPPRLSTTYDPSTRRAVPSHYEVMPDPALRAKFEAAAREGRGPIYPAELGHGPGSHAAGASAALRNAAMRNSDSLGISVDYQTMDEKTFEKFLTGIRRQRPEVRRFLASNAIVAARRKVALQYARTRDNAVKIAEDKDNVPARVTEAQLPLPEVAEGAEAMLQAQADQSLSSFTVDLFDQSRQSKSGLTPLWRLWLAKQKSQWVLDKESDVLKVSSSQSSEDKQPPLHPEAGLHYSYTDSIQSQLLAEALPARVLEHFTDSSTRSRNPTSYTIAVGGRLAKADHSNEYDGQVVDWAQFEEDKGTAYVKPMWTEEESWRDREARQLLSKPKNANKLPIDSTDVKILQARTVTRRDDEESMTRQGRRAGDGVTIRKARGIPGSARWIGELEGRMGYDPSEGAFQAVDYGSLSGMGGSNGQQVNVRRGPQRRSPAQGSSRNNLERYNDLLNIGNARRRNERS